MSARLPYSLIKNPDQPDPRVAILDDRIHLDWQGLLEDIDRWIQSFPVDSAISHHLMQFKIFTESLHNSLVAKFNNTISEPSQDRRFLFESLINGVLTSQWFVLRQVIQQRLPGNPYLNEINKLEKQMADFYGQLYQALPPSAQSKVTSAPPFVYLGRVTELTIFRQPGTPTVVSLPIGVLTANNSKSIGAVAHETGHAIFSCIPNFVEELTTKVTNQYKTVLKHQKPVVKTVVKTILGWLEEMVADCTGTALEGLLHGESAIWITTPLDQKFGIGNNTHPPGPLRPFTHLFMLNYLAREFAEDERGAQYQNEADQLAKKIDIVYGDLTKRRFESIQALTVVTLADVKALMENIILYVLRDCKLATLDDMTLGDVLTQCIQGDFAPAMPTRENWGEAIADKGEDFILELPVFTLDHIDPIWSPLCRLLGIECSTSS